MMLWVFDKLSSHGRECKREIPPLIVPVLFGFNCGSASLGKALTTCNRFNFTELADSLSTTSNDTSESISPENDVTRLENDGRASG